MSVAAALCPMPITLTMLSVLIWYLGAYEAAPVFVAVFTSYSCLCGTGLFQALRAQGEAFKGYGPEKAGAGGKGAGSGGDKDQGRSSITSRGSRRGSKSSRMGGASRDSLAKKGESRQVSAEHSISYLLKPSLGQRRAVKRW